MNFNPHFRTVNSGPETRIGNALEQNQAQASGDHDAIEQLQQQLVRELKRLDDDCEEKKEKVRAK